MAAAQYCSHSWQLSSLLLAKGKEARGEKHGEM